ncbi:hypothetical protein FisN_30Hu008 [Fistulifera solaris]|uniref:Uncharacterized protein n=1 Tax=Fistulifera solaris TaxID=1519565 RepID=A0A1Z5K6G4_FISSO|nr:hypothetical protein FisN_30Hu008 [Fistulifera solaris]|eukprot:GAX21809.1 hypothetical protein FisN_30Hu008 [Fistulifera solaris]
MSSLTQSALFEIIPTSRRTPEQVPRWADERESETYRLRRLPQNLNEIHQGGTVIWRDNGTLTYVAGDNEDDVPDAFHEYLTVSFGGKGPTLHIVGPTDDVMAETAGFFMELEESATEENSVLEVSYSMGTFEFEAAGTRCLERLFAAAPSRRVQFHMLTLSAEQSVVLASQSNRLTLFKCHFEDFGAAFVDALPQRQQKFGSLAFVADTPFDNHNLRHLLQVETIERLTLPNIEAELALLPFSAKVESLDYQIAYTSLQEADLQTLNIAASKLSLTLYYTKAFPTKLVLSLLRRLAALGHFIELRLQFDSFGRNNKIPEEVVTELCRAVLGNPTLNILDLGVHPEYLDWGPHMETLLKDLKDHKGLSHLIVNVPTSAFGPDFAFLRQLLAHKKNITVANENGKVYSRLSRRSKGVQLTVEALMDLTQSSLITAALMQSMF